MCECARVCVNVWEKDLEIGVRVCVCVFVSMSVSVWVHSAGIFVLQSMCVCVYVCICVCVYQKSPKAVHCLSSKRPLPAKKNHIYTQLVLEKEPYNTVCGPVHLLGTQMHLMFAREPYISAKEPCNSAKQSCNSESETQKRLWQSPRGVFPQNFAVFWLLRISNVEFWNGAHRNGWRTMRSRTIWPNCVLVRRSRTLYTHALTHSHTRICTCV